MSDCIKLTDAEIKSEKVYKIKPIELRIGTYLYYRRNGFVEKTWVTKITNVFVYVEGLEKRIDKKTLVSEDGAFFTYSFQANGACDDQKLHY